MSVAATLREVQSIASRFAFSVDFLLSMGERFVLHVLCRAKGSILTGHPNSQRCGLRPSNGRRHRVTVGQGTLSSAERQADLSGNPLPPTTEV